MGEGIYREVLKNPLIACRVYAPVGEHRDLLAYLVRRLLENGANSSFVHQLADESVGMDQLLASPLRLQSRPRCRCRPSCTAPQRKNSMGLDLTVESMRAPLLRGVRRGAGPAHAGADVPQVDAAVAALRSGLRRLARDAGRAARRASCAAPPTRWKRGCPTCARCWSRKRARPGATAWPKCARRWTSCATTPTKPSASCSRWRCPARPARATSCACTARGPWVCISPWNFPLAIFTGQVAAALATGNTVLAKPAEQTPAIAARSGRSCCTTPACRAMRCNCCTAPAKPSARRWWPTRASPASCFTGSTQVAKIIQRALAAKDGPIVPLIAETGGINAMVVDSTALPEQVVDAVVQSAFRSAGQRCSALRLLCVHEGIADGVIEMIQGAARELVTGDPAQLATDVGPVIDGEAYRRHSQRRSPRSATRMPDADPASRRRAASIPVSPGCQALHRAASLRGRPHRRRASRRSSARCCTSCAGAATRKP